MAGPGSGPPVYLTRSPNEIFVVYNWTSAVNIMLFYSEIIFKIKFPFLKNTVLPKIGCGSVAPSVDRDRRLCYRTSLVSSSSICSLELPATGHSVIALITFFPSTAQDISFPQILPHNLLRHFCSHRVHGLVNSVIVSLFEPR